jgi:hypothetical protein
VRKRDRAEFDTYVRYVANALELRDWTIAITIAEPDSTDRHDGLKWGASSSSTPGQKHVHLTFAPDVRSWDMEELRQTVAHELVHAHLAPLIEMCRQDLRGHLAQSAYDLFNDSVTRWLEFAVDALSIAASKHLPLIEWPKPGGRK